MGKFIQCHTSATDDSEILNTQNYEQWQRENVTNTYLW